MAKKRKDTGAKPPEGDGAKPKDSESPVEKKKAEPPPLPRYPGRMLEMLSYDFKLKHPGFKSNHAKDLPKGFRCSAGESGARYKDRLDLGLIMADKYCGGAGAFTRNLAKAAPVLWSEERAHKGRAILANAGQANAMTGEEGLRDCRFIAESLADILKMPADEVLLASTGIIGQKLDVDAIARCLPDLCVDLNKKSFQRFAVSITTTDTFHKMLILRDILPDGKSYQLTACAKGSGMIAPNMATMLAFAMTDVPADSDYLQRVLLKAVRKSFNRITVDGDTSTNDSVFLLSSGANGSEPLSDDPSGPNALRFESGLVRAMVNLSGMLMADAEGATKMVEIVVRKAPSKKAAELVCRAIAESPLVKTAFFGEDPNWGRILAAIGRSGAPVDPYKVDLDLEKVPWVRSGMDNGEEKRAKEIMKLKSYTLTVALNDGAASHAMLACDLSHKYVEINGSYRS